jgi:acetyl-CoA carboxylase carboxyltransferase component
VPLIGIASGRCFAGNAVLLGCCDVIIATRIRPSAWPARR